MNAHRVTVCPTCAAPESRSIDLGGHRLRRCAACGLVYAPEYADPSEVFVDGYLLGDTVFGMHVDVRHPRFQSYLAQLCDRRVARLETVAGRGGSLLDVGCGTGEFLAAARNRGWRVQGVEPISGEATYAREDRGIDVVCATLDESELPERGYDVVSAVHVLEHMPDVRGFVRMLARWVRPGGHLLVESPNFGGRLRRRSGRSWRELRPLEHISHFTPSTLRAVLAAAGVEPVLVGAPTYVGPPQTLDQALFDLATPEAHRWLAPLCSEQEVQGGRTRVPGRVGWWALHALERLYDAGGVGNVAIAVARVG